VTDLNGDGSPDVISPDVIWQNDTTGEVTAWYQHKITRQVTYWSMSGAQLTAWGMLAGPTRGWGVAGATDLNGDGTPDLLWQNDSTYQSAVWFLRGGPAPAVYDWAWLASSGVSGWHRP
jgi:hypothetical protein